MSTKRGIALFDIDKTIYNGYIIFPLAEYLFKNKLIEKQILDSLTSDLVMYKNKKVDYETTVENLNVHFASGLKGCSPELIFEKTEEFLKTKEGNNFYPFAKTLIEKMRKTHDVYFITGELQFVGKAVSEYFSSGGHISSEIEIIDNKFTGNISKSLAKREEKRDSVKQLLSLYSHENSFAFGDSDGDIEMLNQVKNAFCINVTDGLREVAISKGWNVETPESIIDQVMKRI